MIFTHSDFNTLAVFTQTFSLGLDAFRNDVWYGVSGSLSQAAYQYKHIADRINEACRRPTPQTSFALKKYICEERSITRLFIHEQI